MTLYSKWHDHHREPGCAPNPDYPDGIDADASMGLPSCKTELPYPAPRCGHFIVGCIECGVRIMITTAGRPDDPRSIKVPCKRIQHPPYKQSYTYK